MRIIRSASTLSTFLHIHRLDIVTDNHPNIPFICVLTLSLKVENPMIYLKGNFAHLERWGENWLTLDKDGNRYLFSWTKLRSAGNSFLVYLCFVFLFLWRGQENGYWDNCSRHRWWNKRVGQTCVKDCFYIVQMLFGIKLALLFVFFQNKYDFTNFLTFAFQDLTVLFTRSLI